MEMVTKEKISSFEKYYWMNYGFVIPSSAAIEEILDFARDERILEVGAGTGLWAHILQNKGQKITPVDNWSGMQYHVLSRGDWEPTDGTAVCLGDVSDTWKPSYWTDVESLSGKDAVVKYNIDAKPEGIRHGATPIKRHDVLMICWPEPTGWANDTLKAFKGDKFIYVGEDGKTGDKNLYNTLEKDWRMRGFVDLPNFNGSPTLYTYRRKK